MGRSLAIGTRTASRTPTLPTPPRRWATVALARCLFSLSLTACRSLFHFSPCLPFESPLAPCSLSLAKVDEVPCLPKRPAQPCRVLPFASSTATLQAPPGERESLPRSRVYRSLPFESHCHRHCLESRRGSLFHLSKTAKRHCLSLTHSQAVARYGTSTLGKWTRCHVLTHSQPPSGRGAMPVLPSAASGKPFESHCHRVA